MIQHTLLRHIPVSGIGREVKDARTPLTSLMEHIPSATIGV
jgi:hypothetical protein